MNKVAGIYKITSPSGAVYIGQSWDIKNRFWRYPDQKKWHKQPVLAASFHKHGIKSHSFEIINLLPNDVTQQVLDDYECLYISMFKYAGVKLMNVREGGSRGKHREESKEKIRNTLTGRKRPQEAIDNVSAGMREFWGTDKFIEGCRRGGLAHKGKITSQDTKDKIMLAQPTRTPVSVFTKTGEMVGFYKSQCEAAKRTGYWQADIALWVKNKKPVRRFVFKARTESTNSVIRQQGTNMLTLFKKYKITG